MSTNVNSRLFDRAREAQEYWTNTLWERLIQRDIDTDDLEALRYHVAEAERERSIQEDYPVAEPVEWDSPMETVFKQTLDKWRGIF